MKSHNAEAPASSCKPPSLLRRMFFPPPGPQALQLCLPHSSADLSASFLKISFRSPPAEPTLVHSVLLSKLHRPRSQSPGPLGLTNYALQAEAPGIHVPAGTRCKHHPALKFCLRSERTPRFATTSAIKHPTQAIHPWAC